MDERFAQKDAQAGEGGGTESEWLRVKARVVEDALIRQALEADDEPDPEVVADPPLSKSRYRL